eukprot:Skav211802  [mRNA]  locus=scaffold305:410378:413520:+ [translate_table: standard]
MVSTPHSTDPHRSPQSHIVGPFIFRPCDPASGAGGFPVSPMGTTMTSQTAGQTCCPEEMGNIEEVPLDSFEQWRSGIPNSRVVHMKGYGSHSNVGMYYDEARVNDWLLLGSP